MYGEPGVVGIVYKLNYIVNLITKAERIAKSIDRSVYGGDDPYSVPYINRDVLTKDEAKQLRAIVSECLVKVKNTRKGVLGSEECHDYILTKKRKLSLETEYDTENDFEESVKTEESQELEEIYHIEENKQVDETDQDL